MYITNSNPSQINLMEELNAINKENALKKRLQDNISLTHMNNFNETRKVERLKVFQQIQVYIKRRDFSKLSEFTKQNLLKDDNMHKEFTDKIEYNKPKRKSTGQLENSKDRLVFLNKLITSQTNGYDPVKNFMQKYRMKNQVIQERRTRERTLRLKFLKSKEIKNSKNRLIATTNRLKARQQQQETDAQSKKDRLIERRNRRNKMMNSEKKKQPVKNSVVLREQVETEETIIKQIKNSQLQRIEDISFKDGDITENTDFLPAGVYELPKYDRALIFKYQVNFNNFSDKVIDLIDNEGDLLLHINMRDNKSIILNSNINNIWGKEIRIEHTLEGKMDIKILAKSDFFKILLNNKVISFFIERKKSVISFVNINEDVRDFVFKIM